MYLLLLYQQAMQITCVINFHNLHASTERCKECANVLLVLSTHDLQDSTKLNCVGIIYMPFLQRNNSFTNRKIAAHISCASFIISSLNIAFRFFSTKKIKRFWNILCRLGQHSCHFYPI